MAAFVEARESARAARKTFFYFQAVDMPLNLASEKNPEVPKLFLAFLRLCSLTKTKRLPGFCLLHVGMQVRLTTTLQMPYAVQDATGTVLEIWFAHDDEEANRSKKGIAASQSLPPEVLLQ